MEQPKKEQNSEQKRGHKPNKARVIWLLLLMLLVFATLIARTGYISIVRHESDVTKVATKTTKSLTLTGTRGTIYDANMVPLAYDE